LGDLDGGATPPLDAAAEMGALANRVLSETAVAKAAALPGFGETALEALAAWAPHTDDDRALAHVVRDLGQYMCAVWAVQLHATPGGLTHASLSRLMAPFGVTTRTRIHAILTYLRFSGLIRPTASRDGREKAFEPTPTLVRLLKARFGRDLMICSRLFPVAGEALARWDEPGMFEAVVGGHGWLFGSALSRRLGDRSESLDVFSGRNGGLTVLGQLVLQACPDGRFPPKGPATPNISEIARRAGVSRPQARSLLKAGEKAGFLIWRPDGTMEFPDKLAAHLGGLLAGNFLGLAWAAEQALSPDVQADARAVLA
jgi:hypothetical protein